jgi:hypothetical protein
MRRSLLAVAGVAAAGLLAGPAVAHADGGGTTPFIQYEAAFTGQVQGLTTGTTVDVNYVDPSGQTSASQYCWSPPPVGQPACGAASSGKLSESGEQTVTALLTNGSEVSTTFPVAGTTPTPTPTPAANVQTLKRTIHLRANTTFTYHLSVPAGFAPTSSAGVNYSIYPATGPGYAVSSPIGSGRQPAYLGVTVLGTSLNDNGVAVTVRTGRLARPMTLRIAARGTVQ